MAPTVVTEMRFEDLVTELIHLECDAIAACEAVMDRLSDAAPIDEVGRFRNDHRQHLEVLTEMAHEAEAEAPTEGDMKEMLTTGKIPMANLMGDGATLKAMKTDEDDTVQAYEQAAAPDKSLPKSRNFFEKALADETRHRDRMERTARFL